MATHLAAVAVAKGQPFEVQSRPTPKPGPGELLIAVKSVALNPADAIMRGTGLLVSTYPTILGFDISGLILEVGEDVPDYAPEGRQEALFQPGITRVAAYSASVWKASEAACGPDYGAFQEKCLVPWQYAVPLTTEGISWNEAATLPVAVQVPLSAWDAMGIPRLGEAVAPSKPSTGMKDTLLIWGASSSVGSMGVQTARLLRDDPNSPFAAVYATAGAANQEYVSSLGADRVFDYKDAKVVDKITLAAREDGVRIRHCFLAMGQLSQCQAVLKAFIGDHQEGENDKGRIASAPPVPEEAEEIHGLETIFVMPSNDTEERLAQFQYWLGTYLRHNLVRKTIKPSPKPRVVGKGVRAINDGVDMMMQGVSCTKLIVQISD